MSTFPIVHLTLQKLKERQSEKNYLRVQVDHGEELNTVCTFNEPARDSDFKRLIKETNLIIPPDYMDFLKIHNGGVLYSLGEYGGGIELFSVEEIIENYEFYKDDLLESFYPIGIDNGEELLLIKSNNCDPLRRDKNYLFWSDVLDLEDPIDLNCNFEIWLDRLVMAQGNKYWYWNIYTAETYYKTHK
ncbi:hypothetical protein Back11_58040 [Paenibacillus baekrokdamisoli]|uniref:Uncharacterized protein n=1 Tax=Paenibacillus baekrokdamisoli TaxID=1712516 RepID=A0A3G9JN44_9BACL|nr:SMI1/KNR4 family protein [Paenibacillus baekrokdamisoli]MBB3071510.1 hypothetical protein [Paenibacillus baekrokdamisoli]BBH24459.1 hypothetical protein Back11_58040 [Paenibacillus baekrokdamisoli]